MTGNGILDAKYALKEAYWAKASWGLNRTIVKKIAQLKDSDGQYLWKPGGAGLAGSEPDRLHGFPIWMSEYVSNTVAANAYIGILGDFSFYHIAESLEFGIQRLNELYAETNQVGFIGRGEVDGMPVLEEAFVRLQCAAS